MARHPAPTPLKLVRGDRESRINRDEPIPSDDEIIPPDMSDEAAEIWNALAPDLVDKNVLTKWDVYSFSIVCEAIATYQENRKLMGKNYTDRGAAGGVIKSPHWQIMRDCAETIAKYSSRFGLTPADRANLKIDGDSGGPKHGAERILG